MPPQAQRGIHIGPLTPEIWISILCNVNRQDICNIRCVNRSLEVLATPFLYSAITLRQGFTSVRVIKDTFRNSYKNAMITLSFFDGNPPQNYKSGRVVPLLQIKETFPKLSRLTSGLRFPVQPIEIPTLLSLHAIYTPPVHSFLKKNPQLHTLELSLIHEDVWQLIEDDNARRENAKATRKKKEEEENDSLLDSGNADLSVSSEGGDTSTTSQSVTPGESSSSKQHPSGINREKDNTKTRTSVGRPSQVHVNPDITTLTLRQMSGAADTSFIPTLDCCAITFPGVQSLWILPSHANPAGININFISAQLYQIPKLGQIGKFPNLQVIHLEFFVQGPCLYSKETLLQLLDPYVQYTARFLPELRNVGIKIKGRHTRVLYGDILGEVDWERLLTCSIFKRRIPLGLEDVGRGYNRSAGPVPLSYPHLMDSQLASSTMKDYLPYWMLKDIDAGVVHTSCFWGK